MIDYGGEPVFQAGGDVNLYSAYNPNAKSSTHNYTTSQAEQDSLISAGWLYDQVAWKVLGEGNGETDPSLFERFAGQEFVKNIWRFAGGPSAFLIVNADGTYQETSVRLSSQPGIGSEYARYSDSYKANFPGSYFLYTADGLTFMFVKSQ